MASIGELKYLNSLRYILDNGEERQTRNAKTLSIFGIQLEFDLKDGFPLLTTKKMYWKGIIEELLWFLKSDTDSKNLSNKKVRIWDGNSTREYLDTRGLNQYEEGWCGPIYGYQWRHFNAEYKGPNHDYTGQGVDQLKNCIELIKNNPTSRRIYMSAWNPCQLDEMCLPPCHISYQFYVENANSNCLSDRKLSCQMYQRSGDMFLGVPFNIASTALLTNMIANHCGISLGKIKLVIGDAHIYQSHVNQVKEQLKRSPSILPSILIKKKVDDLSEYNSSDIELLDYHSAGPIKARMVV